jgi:hypothetical protein
MALDTNSIEHNCNTLRRQIQDEFPRLALHFIVYQPGKVGKAIAHKREEIGDHPAAAQIMPLLQKTDPDKDFFVLASAKEKHFLPFLAREKTLACIFLQDAGFEEGDQVRHHALFLTWHVLTKIIEGDDTFSAISEETLSWHNMLADAFAALSLEMHGKKGFIRALARRRAQMTLEPTPDYIAEDYPYPVVMDAAQLVYDDTRKAGTLSKSKLYTQALEMTREIGITFDAATVLQWWAFAKPAQEMAWLGIDRNRIIGAAVHSSEDPYARSTAYLVAEILNIEPGLMSDITLYNAFTDQEANERHHKKLCDDLLQDLLSRREPESNGDIFRNEAIKQNKKLLEGQLIGWCAPALILTGQIFDKKTSEMAKLEEVKRAYSEACRKTNSEVLRKLGLILINLRRASDEITVLRVAEAILRDDHVVVQDLADALLLQE